MGDKTNIEWTDATWNPVTGCTKVSQGCKHCYAERLFPKVYPGRAFTDVRTHEDRLDQPMRWRKPKLIFVNSMSDLFHEDIPDEFIDKVFAVMNRARHHTFQVLTKRPERMRDYLNHPERKGRIIQAAFEIPLCAVEWMRLPIPTVWLGVSAEDQATFDERVGILAQVPAAVRFVSAEPLLGEIDVGNAFDDPPDESPYGRIHWLIAGGESGQGARPSHPDWFRSLRDQCAAAGVAFLFKQWGEHLPGEIARGDVSLRWQDGSVEFYGDHQDIKYANSWLSNDDGRLTVSHRVGKKAAGRELDGRIHDEYPTTSI